MATAVNLRELLDQHPSDVAPLLLGARITSTLNGVRVAVRITEVEAYGGVGEDPSSHAYRRMTPRNASMFGRPGLLYVYFTYGMHFCANVVTSAEGTAGAVLLRAGEVIAGRDVARMRRPAARKDRDLARGPARLASALHIDRSVDGTDLLGRASPVRLSIADAAEELKVAGSTRIGVNGPGAMTPWRWYLADDPTVSAQRSNASQMGL